MFGNLFGRSKKSHRKFNIGDKVKVKYREQFGRIIDINGSLYMVSINDGQFVDSFTENQLQRYY